MSGMIPVRQYTNVAEMRDAHRAIRCRTYAQKPVELPPARRVRRIEITAAPPDQTGIPIQRCLDALDRLVENASRQIIATRRAPAPVLVLARVAAAFEVSAGDILSTSRMKRFVEPRHVVMLLFRQLCNLSSPDIGSRLGRDHTSVLSGQRRVEARMAANPDFAAKVDAIRDGIAREWDEAWRASQPPGTTGGEG